MADMYGFVHDVEPLKKIESHSKTIMDMVLQTIDCGYFIRGYAKNNFGECTVDTGPHTQWFICF